MPLLLVRCLRWCVDLLRRPFHLVAAAGRWIKRAANLQRATYATGGRWHCKNPLHTSDGKEPSH